MQRLYKLTQRPIDRFGWITLISSTVQTDTRMLSNAVHIILCILQKHVLVHRIGSISRISQPKILPHHNAIAVTSLVKLLITGLPYPVAYHVIIHIAVILHGNIVFPTPIVQIALTEAPVASQWYEAFPIDIHR